MNDDTLVVVPSRLAATRLPNKPILPIGSKSMIRHVITRLKLSGFTNILLASGDQGIIDEVAQDHIHSVLTDPNLPSGTDRVHAAVKQYDHEGKFKFIVNLQGDMPNFDPNIIGECINVLVKSGADIATLCAETSLEDADKFSVVKPVFGEVKDGIARAFYFSRSKIPYFAERFYHHLGIYSFKRDALDKFVSLPPSKMEVEEKLEQLRALENGMTIAIGFTKHIPISVDTPEDLENARKIMSGC